MAMDQAHDEAQMGFLDHLEELRRRLFISVAAVFAAAAVLFVKKDWVFDAVLFAPRNPDFISYRAWCALSHAVGSGDALCVDNIAYELINTTMLGNFSAHIVVSLVGGWCSRSPFSFTNCGPLFAPRCVPASAVRHEVQGCRPACCFCWAWRLGTTSSRR